MGTEITHQATGSYLNHRHRSRCSVCIESLAVNVDRGGNVVNGTHDAPQASTEDSTGKAYTRAQFKLARNARRNWGAGGHQL